MRGIRALAPVEDVESKSASTREPGSGWSPLQGGLFGVGMLVVMAGLLLAAYCGYIVSRIDTSKPEQLTKFEEGIDKTFDTMKVDMGYEVLHQYKEQGIGPRIPPDYVIRQRVSSIYQNGLIAALVATGIGLAITGSSFVLKSKR